MIIDFHTHTYPDKIAAKTVDLLSGRSGTVPQSDGTFEGLENDMEMRHVDMSIVLPVATSPKQYMKLQWRKMRISTVHIYGRSVEFIQKMIITRRY